MKILSFLILLTFANLINASEVLRISKSERIRFNAEFSENILPLMESYGTGDIVGNGGGLLEQNFLLAYYSLQTAIENCLTLEECYSSVNQRLILKEINQLFIDKIRNKTPLVFIKNSDTNNFFYDEYDQTERVAKTGFSKKYPIFINLDVTTNIVNDVPAMLGIIIHELGHQAGIVSHNFLDQLGAKIRKMWLSNWVISDVNVSGENLLVRLFSTNSNLINSKLSYVFNGKVQSLNSLIYRNISCGEGETLYGFSLSNGHWQRPVNTSFRTTIKKTFWLDVYCEDTNSQSYLVKKDLDIRFIFNSFRNKYPILKSVEADVH